MSDAVQKSVVLYQCANITGIVFGILGLFLLNVFFISKIKHFANVYSNHVSRGWKPVIQIQMYYWCVYILYVLQFLIILLFASSQRDTSDTIMECSVRISNYIHIKLCD